jgi:hypothetical protein
MAAKSCDNCIYVHRLDSRDDEKERGLILGCKKPGWESYTSLTKMECGGVFWVEKKESEVTPTKELPDETKYTTRAT